MSKPKNINFDSRQYAYNQLLDTLEKKEGSVMLGIYGLPGVGKSAFIEQVSERVKELQIFDDVAVVDANQVVDAQTLMSKIGSCLNVEFFGDVEDQASLLAARWDYGSNILIILDDIENKIPLEEFGIPFGDNKWSKTTLDDDIRTPPGEDRRVKGCKILLTSKTRDVCDINDCYDYFQIEKLERDEAWELFTDIVGTTTIDSLDDKDLAKTVCKSCNGLPLEIAAVGISLRDKVGDDSWRDAFTQFVIHGKVPLEVSFNALPKDAKSCLFLCSLYDGVGDTMVPVDFLFRTAMGLGLFDDLEMLADARNKLDSMVAILKSSSLLLEGTKNRVKMHSMVRDVARVVAAKDEGYAFHFEARESKWPRIENDFGSFGDEDSVVKLLSLAFDTNDVFEYPDDVVFPNLHTLMLNINNHMDKLRDDFFDAFVNLRHLMISSSPVLPLFSGNLKDDLRMLTISSCALSDISRITELKNLEMLCFDRVDFSTPPIDLQELEHLRVLHFTNCTGLELVKNSVSSLTELQELIITNGHQVFDASELSKLTHLTNLQIHQEEASSVQDLNIWQNLQRYTLSFGEHFDNDDLVSSTKSLKIVGSLEADGIKTLVERSQELVLQGVIDGFENCFHVKNGETFAELTRLKIIVCYDGKYLGKISRGNLNKQVVHSFTKLSVLNISLCKFEFLFSATIARGLEQLQELYIFDCDNMEEIVRDESREDWMEIIAFPKLRSVELWRMSKLITFRHKHSTIASDQFLFNETVQFPALNKLKLYELDGVHNVFDGKVEFSSLKILDVYDLQNLKEIWKLDCNIFELFSELAILKVKYCPKLENLIPLAMIPKMQYLKEPTIENCDLLLPELSTDDEEEPTTE